MSIHLSFIFQFQYTKAASKAGRSRQKSLESRVTLGVFQIGNQILAAVKCDSSEPTKNGDLTELEPQRVRETILLLLLQVQSKIKIM